MRYNSDGTKAWTKVLGGNGYDIISNLSVGADGAIYAVGYTSSRSFDGQVTNGAGDAFIVRYNPDGTKAWTKVLGGDRNDNAYSVSISNEGAIYVAGYTDSSTFGGLATNGFDSFIARYNPDGTNAWTKVIGGNGGEWTSNLTKGVNGSIYAVGSTDSSTYDGQVTNGGYDSYVALFNPDGTKVWTKVLGGRGSDEISSLSIDTDGSIYAAGYTNSSTFEGQVINGIRNSFLIKIPNPKILVLTSSQIQALSSLQAVTLATAQLATLTSTQVSGFTTNAISNFTIDQIAALRSITTTQLVAITTKQIASATTTSIATLGNSQLFSNLSSAQIRAITTSAIIGLGTSALSSLKSMQAGGLTTAQIVALTTAQVSSLSTAIINVLTSVQLQAIEMVDIAALTTLQVKALTSIQISRLTTSQVKAIETTDLMTLSSSQLMGFNSVQVASLTVAELASLNSIQTLGLTTAAIASLSLDQLQAFNISNKRQLGAVTTVQIAAMSAEFVGVQQKWLSDLTSLQISVITTSAITALGTSALSSLKSTQVGGLTTAQIVALTTAQIPYLSTNVFNSLTSSQLRSIATDDIAALTTTQVQSLSSVVLNGLSSSQLKAIETVDIASLTTAQIQSLNSVVLNSLSSSQLQAITTTDIAALTTAQVNSLSSVVLNGLSISQLQAIETIDIAALTTLQVQSLGPLALNGLTSSQFQSIVVSNIAALTTTQIVSLSVSPNVAWTKLLGGSGYDSAQATTISADGIIYVAGSTSSNFVGATNNGYEDVFIKRFNSNGDESWTKFLGGIFSDIPYSLTSSSDGALYVAGGSWHSNLDGQTNSGIEDAFIARYNSAGSKEWTKLMGGSYNDAALALSVGKDSAVYVAGTITNSSFIEDAFITRFNPDGSKAWTNLLEGNGRDVATSLATGTNGTIYVAGYTSSRIFDGQTNKGNEDIFITSYDSSGNKLLTTLYGGSGHDKANSIVISDDGAIYIVGSTDSASFDGQVNYGSEDVFVTRFNSDGTKAWTKLLGGSSSDFANALTIGTDGAIYVAGFTYSDSFDGLTSHGGLDAFVTRYNSDGTKVWTKLLGGSGSDQAKSISTGNDGSIYISGYTNGGNFEGLSNNGNGDAFFVKIDSPNILVSPNFDAMTSSQINAFTSSQTVVLNPLQLANLNSVQTLGFTSTTIKNFSIDQVAALQSMSTIQLAALTTTQITSATTASIATLGNSQLFSYWSTTQISAITSSAIIGLGSSALSSLNSMQVSGLSTAQIAALTTVQIPYLSTVALNSLSSSQLIAIETMDIAALTTAQIQAISTKVLNSFTNYQLQSISTAGVWALSSSQVSMMSTSQLSALTQNPIIQWAPYIEWSEFLGSGGDSATCITTGTDGTIYIAGHTNNSYFDGQSVSSISDAFVARFNADGSKMWTKLYGGSGNGNGITYAADITNGFDGAIYVTGTTPTSWFDNGVLNTAPSVFISRYEADGTKTWSNVLGGTSSTFATSITTGIDGSIYIAGQTHGYGSFDGQTLSGSSDAFITRYNIDGTKSWTKLLGGAGDDRATSLTTGLDGAVYVAGYTTSRNLDDQILNGSSDAFITRYNADGTKAWTKLLGGGYGAQSLTTGKDGAIYVAGGISSNFYGNDGSGIFISRYNVDGTKESTKDLVSDIAFVSSLNTGTDGAIYVSGFSGGSFDGQSNNGGFDTFITRYNPDGTKAWTELTGGSDNNLIGSLNIGKDGAIYVTGSNINYQPYSGSIFLKKITPIVLDLNDNGIKTNPLEKGIAFDITNSGEAVKTGWVTDGDGFLVLDINGDGIINNGGELFGEGTVLATGQKAKNGYQAMAELDTNHDGILNQADKAYSQLQVWTDNGDGITQTSELHSLADLGITSISLASDTSTLVDNGNLIGLMGSYTKADGKTHTMGDVWFQTDSSGNKVFDLASVVKKSGGMSHVDLKAGEPATLNVALNDVLSLGEHDVNGLSTVKIEGDESDSVQLITGQSTQGGEGWSQHGSLIDGEQSYDVYVNQEAQLLVNHKVHTVII